jgi:hypothetical protein
MSQAENVPTTSRRSFMRSAAVASAVLPTTAGLAAVGPDPIYAVIEARKLALARWIAITDEEDPAYNAGGRADAEAIRNLVRTMPTSFAGLLASCGTSPNAKKTETQLPKRMCM